MQSTRRRTLSLSLTGLAAGLASPESKMTQQPKAAPDASVDAELIAACARVLGCTREFDLLLAATDRSRTPLEESALHRLKDLQDQAMDDIVDIQPARTMTGMRAMATAMLALWEKEDGEFVADDPGHTLAIAIAQALAGNGAVA